MSDRYAIGNADSLGVVTALGIKTVEYDLKQVHDEGFVEYELHGEQDDEVSDYETDELLAGDSIPLAIAEDVQGRIRSDVYGFVVPDYLLGRFISEYPDKEIYRQR